VILRARATSVATCLVVVRRADRRRSPVRVSRLSMPPPGSASAGGGAGKSGSGGPRRRQSRIRGSRHRGGGGAGAGAGAGAVPADQREAQAEREAVPGQEPWTVATAATEPRRATTRGAPSTEACLVSDKYAVFVAAGAVGGTGSKEKPLGTIAAGIAKAKTSALTRVSCATPPAPKTSSSKPATAPWPSTAASPSDRQRRRRRRR